MGPGETDANEKNNFESLKSGITNKLSSVALGATTATLMTTFNGISAANSKDKLIWEKIDLSLRETLFDITFDPKKPEHGWLVGAKGTFLETFDGGKTWNTRSFSNLDEDEEISYRFEVANLNDNEGWIVGKPAILLHTKDGGKQFERIPLPPKLPGLLKHFNLNYLLITISISILHLHQATLFLLSLQALMKRKC